MLTIGSLFAGIGGLELGLERAGLGPTLWQVERDPYAQRVLARHWPNARRYDDVCEVGAHNLEPVDLICGGFPCVDISFAGKGAGIYAERSGLWFEFARIVGELGPRYVVVENVAALLVRGMGPVLGTLAALGYDAVWDCIPAAAVGAHHRRDRVFIIARLAHTHRDERRPSRVGPDSRADRRNDPGGACALARGAVADSGSIRRVTGGGSEGPAGEWRAEPACGGEDVADSERVRLRARRNDAGEQEVAEPIDSSTPDTRHQTPDTSRPGNWLPEPNVGRVADRAPSRMDRLRCLGNAVVPQVAEVIGRAIMAAEK